MIAPDQSAQAVISCSKEQLRLCLYSGESVTDSPAVNSRAMVRAKTNSFIVLFCSSLSEIKHRFDNMRSAYKTTDLMTVKAQNVRF